jgi:hypothetical protein
MSGFSGERRQQLVELVNYPGENLGVEIKNWLDLDNRVARADVACALLALANSGGGFLVVGFDRDESGFVVAQPLPDDLAQYDQDAINGIAAHYAEPIFEVAVQMVERSDGSSTHPVIIVPGDLDTPVRARRDGPERQHVTQNTYYIRRPGPQSAPIQTGREWDALLDRCVRTKRELLIDRIREIIEGPDALEAPPDPSADERLREFEALALARWQQLARTELQEGFPGRYRYGTWNFTYQLRGPIRELSLAALHETLRTVAGHETGWPTWWVPDTQDIAPRPWNGRIECWMAQGTGTVLADSGHADYWLADRAGQLFLLRGYEDDSQTQGAPQQPGALFDATIPIWRIGECLLHAERFVRAVAEAPESADVDIAVQWRGLANRRLSGWSSSNRFIPQNPNRGQDAARSRLTVPTTQISDRLPELVQRLTGPLYETFSFFEPSPRMIREELEALRNRR